MSLVAIAIGGSALLGAYSANKAAKAQSGAAKYAGDLQAQAQAEATELQRQMFSKQQENLKPYLDAGYFGLGKLKEGLADGGQFTKRFTMGDFTADPGYQWRLDQGRKAIEAAATARGGAASGRTLKALSDYATNQATATWGDARNNFYQDQDRTYNRYAGLAGTGQTATTQANSSATNYANAITSLLGNGANAQGNYAIQGANANAAGQVGVVNSVMGGINSYLGYRNYQDYLGRAAPSAGASSFTPTTYGPTDYGFGDVKLGGS